MGSIVPTGGANVVSSAVRRLAWLVALAAVVLVIARAIPDTAPESDHAVIDLAVLNVLHGAQPVGAYSRFGWHHPGPFYFQILSPLYWLTGYRHVSITLMAASLNAACLLGIVGIVRRQNDPTALLASTGIIGGTFLARTFGLLASSWNPHVVVLPLVLLIFAAAAAANGALRLFPVVVLVASLVIQTHIGPGLCVIAIVAASAALAATRVGMAARRGARMEWRRPLVVSAIVGGAIWLVPLVDELRPNGLHNLREITHFFLTSPGRSGRAARWAFDYFFIAPFSPMSGLSWGPVAPEPQSWVRALAVTQGVLLLLASSFWLIRKQTFAALTALMTIVASVTAFFSVSRLPEDPKDYTVLWLSALGVASWAVILAVPIDLALSRMKRRLIVSAVVQRWIMPIAIAGVVGLAIVQLAARRSEDVRISRRIDDLTRLVDRGLTEAGSDTVLVHVPETSWGPVAGVVLQLARAGKHPAVDDDWVTMFGRRYAPTGREELTLTFADADEHQRSLHYRLDERLLGTTGAIFVYLGGPKPNAQPANVPIHVLNSYETLGPPEAVVDGRVPARDAPAPWQQALTFIGPAAFVELAVPGTTAPIGIRAVGERGTVWRLACARGNSGFVEIGDVRIGDAVGMSSGDAYLRDLPGCRQLRIYSTSRSVTQWLAEIELLVKR